MKRNLCIIILMMTGLMFWGCSQEEKKAEAPQAVVAVEQALDKAKEASEKAAQQMEKTTEAVAEKTEQQVATAAEKVTAAAAPVVEKVEEQAAPAMKKISEATPPKPTTDVESVTIDNKNGQVVLPHKKHAEAFGCVPCHGNKKPGPQKLGKAAAHALCQGCHKEKKAGPTACNQCHQKKAKAVEGC